MNLKHARVLITGGSLGIGKSAAKLLSEHGARVAITGRDGTRLQAAANETGGHPIVADVTNEDDRKRSVDEAVKTLGGLNVLINNAGIGEFNLLGEINVEQFRRIFETNVFAAALMAQDVIGIFKEQASGTIINIASTAALNGFEGGTVYAASKFALRAMTQCWQKELRKHNIRVIGVNPSEVTTAFGSKDGVERPQQANKLSAEEIAHTIKSVLEMDDRGFIPEVTVWATNPWAK